MRVIEKKKKVLTYYIYTASVPKKMTTRVHVLAQLLVQLVLVGEARARGGGGGGGGHGGMFSWCLRFRVKSASGVSQRTGEDLGEQDSAHWRFP